VVTDDAKRIHEALQLAVVFQPWEVRQTGWMAFALADGATDHIIYPSRQDAIAHMSDEHRYFYVCLRSCPTGMPVKDAQLLLDVHREAADAGLGFTEPQAPQIIMPVSRGVGKWPQ
jgi:hypothetical protein